MEDSSDPKPFAWVETAGAVLMAVSSLGTAWCSYEVSRWSAHASGTSEKVSRLERDAFLMRIEGTQIQAVQGQMFMEYVAAHLSGNAALERFYTDRFAAEVKKAFDGWIVQKPFENPSAPPHPFVPTLYEPRYARDIERNQRDAAALGTEARAAGETADRYLTNTIILATVLFFIGITSRLSTSRLRLGTFLFGATLFAFALIRVATLGVKF